MSDQLVDSVRDEDYLLQVMSLTKDSLYTNFTIKVIKFVKEIYRVIEPSHFDGKLIVFIKKDDVELFEGKLVGEKFYDDGILNHNFKSIAFQIFQSAELPLIYKNIDGIAISEIVSATEYIAYVFEKGNEFIFVNGEQIKIINKYSCPSIFALQYHFLNEELLRYRNERVKKVSCEHFKKSWADENCLYFINKPEDSIQLAIAEFLKNSLKGVDIVREYNLGASKPVDLRVYWTKSNRAALIEVKLMGRSVKKNGKLNTYEYGMDRANDGMKQIKEYIDLGSSDSPTVINKGYLVVLDGRRNGINPKVTSVSVANGMYYANSELVIDADKEYYNDHNNIEKPWRMFAEPICK